jgi:hypothetical protein
VGAFIATLPSCTQAEQHSFVRPCHPQMGLGKTAQSIAVLQYKRQICRIRGPFLVVAPLTTLGHWQREIQTWTDMVRPSLTLPTLRLTLSVFDWHCWVPLLACLCQCLIGIAGCHC